MMNEILEKFGLKYDDLNTIERETLNTWVESLQKNKLTVETIKTYVSAMRESVEQEVTVTGNNSKQDLLLKARLRNYLLLEAFLSTPQKAQQALDKAISGLVMKKG